jgi:hypothetical protein
MGLLLHLTVAVTCATYEFAYMARYGVMFFVPLYLQLLGNSPSLQPKQAFDSFRRVRAQQLTRYVLELLFVRREITGG